MIATTYTLSGEKSTKVVTLSPKIFGVEVNPRFLAQAVRVHLNNLRRSPAKVKTRAEVEGSTRKIYRQKGTGKARHGSIRAPIFVGGGIAHGPDGTQNYSAKLPIKMRKLAIVESLSAKAHDKQITVITGVDKASGKTKQLAWLATGKSCLVVSTPLEVKFNLAVQNLDSTDVAYANQLNAHQVLGHSQLFVTEPALELLNKTYAH